MADYRGTITQALRRTTFGPSLDQREPLSISGTPRAPRAILSGRPLTATGPVVDDRQNDKPDRPNRPARRL